MPQQLVPQQLVQPGKSTNMSGRITENTGGHFGTANAPKWLSTSFHIHTKVSLNMCDSIDVTAASGVGPTCKARPSPVYSRVHCPGLLPHKHQSSANNGNTPRTQPLSQPGPALAEWHLENTGKPFSFPNTQSIVISAGHPSLRSCKPPDHGAEPASARLTELDW